MLCVYKNLSTLFGHLFKSKDEQPDAVDMYDSESKESTDQERKGLKILTSSQMLTRFPITLAQLKAGNNSEKFKNKIRQLLYSLYRDQKT